MNQSENLYDKLNNVHASLRKQKEDAFRTKQLAEQRLAIQKQDREGVEKKGADTRAKLRTLKERAVEMKNVNGVNEAENKQFEKEYQFGHSELQGKKEKLSRLEDKEVEETNMRNNTMSAAKELLRHKRENSSKNDMSNYAANFTTEEKRRKLEQQMEVEGIEELCRNLPHLVKMGKLRKEDEVKGMEIRNASLRRIIAGYKNALGGAGDAMMMEIMNGGNDVIMQQ